MKFIDQLRLLKPHSKPLMILTEDWEYDSRPEDLIGKYRARYPVFADRVYHVHRYASKKYKKTLIIIWRME